MKRLKYLFPLLIGLMLFGCSDFLEVDPINTQSEQNFFDVPENAILAVNACYQLIGMSEGPGPDENWLNHNHEFIWGDIASDDAEKGSDVTDFPDITDIARWTAKSGNGVTYALWIKIFDGVSRCNTALTRLENSPLDDALRLRLMGEVHFLRAYYYFYGARVFGGLPIFTKNVTAAEFGKVDRASLHETFLQIEKDFKQAVELLPLKSRYKSEDLGRATKGAARHYLSRLYMYMIGTDIDNTEIGWQQVYDQTNAIINSAEYSLVANYATIFEPEGENSSESIFELQMLEGSTDKVPAATGSNFSRFQANRLDWGWGFNNPTVDLFNTFEADDPRLSATVYGPDYNSGIMGGVIWEYDISQQMTPYLNRKAAVMPGERPSITSSSSTNVRKARYAETLLNHAEAAYHLNKEGEARNMVNAIRGRARTSTYARGFNEGALDYPATGFSGNLPDITASGESLLEAIYHERRTELAMEALRLWDLIRTGRYVSVLNKIQTTFQNATNDSLVYTTIPMEANAKSHSLIGPNGNIVPIAPIPMDDVADWNIEQNPGY